MADEKLKRHVFTFNPDSNGGEALMLTTDYYWDGEDEVYTNQQLTMCCYGKEVSFNLGSALLNPAVLRNLADQLEQSESLAYDKLLKKEVSRGEGFELFHVCKSAFHE